MSVPLWPSVRRCTTNSPSRSTARSRIPNRPKGAPAADGEGWEVVPSGWRVCQEALVNPDTVIRDLGGQEPLVYAQPDEHGGGAGVLGHVGERFLHNAEDRRLYRRGEATGGVLTFDLHLYRYAVVLLVRGSKPVNSRDEAVIVEDGRAQRQGEVPQIVERILGQPL